MATIRNAIHALLFVCDGAKQTDGQGFNRLDGGFARSLSGQNEWTDAQQAVARKMLKKYRGQLSGFGIDWEVLEDEPTRTGRKAVKVQEPVSQVIELYAKSKRLFCKSPFSFKETAKAIAHANGGYHGKWNPEERAWEYYLDDDVFDGFLPHIMNGQVIPTAEVQELYSQRKNAMERIDEAARVKEAEDLSGIVLPVKFPRPDMKPFDHQKKAFKLSMTLDNIALLMEQGTGKSLVTVAASGQRYLNGEVKRLLVICPKKVVPVWPMEFKEYADFPVTVQPLNEKYSTVKKAEIIKHWKDGEGLQVIVTNYQSVWRILDDLLKWKPQMVVLDESQNIKNHGSKQSKACHAFRRTADHRMILTGTPVTQAPTDFFSQYKFLQPSIFGESFVRFREEYCVMGGWEGKQIVGYKDLAKLAAKAHSIAFRVLKKDCLDLPDMLDEVEYCYKDACAQAYKKMKDEMVLLLEENEATAAIVITQMLRLQQITGGFLPVVNKETQEKLVLSVGSEKLTLLKETLEDLLPLGKKVVIFARFRAEIDAISDLLSDLETHHVILDGRTKDAGQVVETFQKNPQCMAIVAQIQAGGAGITLHAADTMIFYSMDFSYANYEQAKARIHRIGQKNNCTYIHLVMEGTIDETILAAVQQKRNIADLVVDQMKNGKL